LVAGDVLLGGDTYRHFQNAPAAIRWSPDRVIEQTRPNVRHRLKPMSAHTQMTTQLAEFLGAVVGDGSQGVVSRENVVSVAIGKDQPEYLTHVKGLVAGLFDEEPVTEDKGAVTLVSYCSKLAVDFLDSLGLPEGCTYKTKRVPAVIWASSNEYRAAFLRGLFDTDGYALDCLGLSCYNGDLAGDVQGLLADMGIQSAVSRVDNDHNHIWVLKVVGRESLFKFRDRIGFTIAQKYEGLVRLTDTANCVGGGVHVPYLQRRVVEIAEQYGITTYNERSLGYSVNQMQHGRQYGVNALYGFALRAVEAGYTDFLEVYSFLRNPLYVVNRVEDGGAVETVDIALFDGSHDFLADGVVSHNTDPLYIYCLDSNPEVDHVTVIAHALGHGDFFHNNVFFDPTSGNMMNELASHGTRIERYMGRWGRQEVGEFIDRVLSIDDMLDPRRALEKRKYKEPAVEDKREYSHPHRFNTADGHDYMQPWLNEPGWIERQKKAIREREIRKSIGIFDGKIRDVFGFLKDNAPLNWWQRDVMSMLYEESMYFSPQRFTKTINEGWASFVDYNIMVRGGMAGNEGIVDYAMHKAGVLGGKYSMNPYALGYALFTEIEDRYNKGKFGPEYELCDDMRERANWDKKVGLGHKKVFEVRELYNDYTLIAEFFDQDFCDKYEFFEWERFPNGEYKIVSRDASKIKTGLLQRYQNGGLPDIRLVEPNFRGRRVMLLEHQWDGRTLDPRETVETLCALQYIWKAPVAVCTRDEDDQEVVYCCSVAKADKVEYLSRKEFEQKAF
jgi:stage V sporulation protein R